MPEQDENLDPALLPNGTMAIVQHRGILCLGVKGGDGVWRDKNGLLLQIEKIVSVLSPGAETIR